MNPETPLRTHCGMRCDLCPAFPPNRAGADRQRASRIWEEVFEFRITPEEIACGGCRGHTNDALDKACPVRPCVLAKGFDDCGQCPEMPCETLKRRWVSRPELEARLGRPIPEEDFRNYVLPFENAPYLLEQVKRRKTS